MYLATVFYHKENILVTAEDQIPLVEIQCCSTSIVHNFPWFAKVSCQSKHMRASLQHINCWRLMNPNPPNYFLKTKQNLFICTINLIKLSVFFFFSAVLCMATSSLAAAGPLLCSFVLLLPPPIQAQHFTSCFPAAGRKLSSLTLPDKKQ